MIDQAIINAACDAEEVFFLDELEDFAAAQTDVSSRVSSRDLENETAK